MYNNEQIKKSKIRLYKNGQKSEKFRIVYEGYNL